MPLFQADTDVLLFLFDITRNVWMYKFYCTRRWLIVVDRMGDMVEVALFVVYYSKSYPYWEVHLGVYVFLRLVSLALCYDTDRWECYAVRMVLALIISGLLCDVPIFVLMILELPEFTLVAFPLILCVLFIGLYIVWYSHLNRCHFIFEFEYDPFQKRWFNMFTNTRKSAMVWLDRFVDLFAVVLFVALYDSG